MLEKEHGAAHIQVSVFNMICITWTKKLSVTDNAP